MEDENVISDKDKEILDYISEREVYYSDEIKSKICEDLKNKFGQEGVDLYKQLDVDTSNVVDETCPECAKEADEWIRQSQEALRIIQNCMDESLTDTANSIIDYSSGSRISREDIVNAISQATGKKVSNIKEKDIERMCQKIIFIGLLDGWLIDEYFIDMQPSNTDETDGSESGEITEEDN